MSRQYIEVWRRIATDESVNIVGTREAIDAQIATHEGEWQLTFSEVVSEE